MSLNSARLGATIVSISSAATSATASLASGTSPTGMRYILGIAGGANASGLGTLTAGGVDKCYAMFSLGKRNFKYDFPAPIPVMASVSVQLEVSSGAGSSTYANFSYVNV